MSRSANLVLLCEGLQHSAFMKRYLEKAGLSKRDLRVVPVPPGKGSALKFVVDQFPGELREYRKRRNRVKCKLVVMLDGDEIGVHGRKIMLDNACEEQRVRPRSKNEAVADFVPTWNIETWLAYLGGQNIDG